MTVNRPSVGWCILLIFVVLLAAGNNTAQASHKDDEIIVCTTPDNCFPQGDSNDDPSGDDASGIISYGGGKPSPPPTTTKPPVTTPQTTTTTTGATVTTTVPQVVTLPTVTTSRAATTTVAATPKPPPTCNNLPDLAALPATMDRNSTTGVCTPKCLNHPDYTYVPDRFFKDAAGNCLPRGEDDYGLCKGDQYQLVRYSDVDRWLNDGYSMGIIVDTPDQNYRLNCLITDVTTYRMNPKDFVFSGKYVQDGWPNDWQEFDTPLPYPWSAWKPLYPLWVKRSSTNQLVASQSTESILAYGLLWYGGHRYQNATTFSKYLKKHHARWRVWKKQYPDISAALLTHQRLLRRR